MNANRRRRLIQIIEKATQLQEQLRTIQEEEQNALENVPESLQYTDRYCDMEQAAEVLGEAADTLEDTINGLEAIL